MNKNEIVDKKITNKKTCIMEDKFYLGADMKFLNANVKAEFSNIVDDKATLLIKSQDTQDAEPVKIEELISQMGGDDKIKKILGSELSLKLSKVYLKYPLVDNSDGNADNAKVDKIIGVPNVEYAIRMDIDLDLEKIETIPFIKKIKNFITFNSLTFAAWRTEDEDIIKDLNLSDAT
jgi:hypothetical protein